MSRIVEFRDIDRLSPTDFEFFVRDVFEAAGWTDLVVTKPNSEYRHGDGGVDIFGRREDRRYAIEVKQRAAGSAVGFDALSQLVAGAELAKVPNRILVTNSYFTSEVRVRALRLGVELIDRDALQSLWLQKHTEIGSRIRPRKYQQAVIDEITSRFQLGEDRFLIEMATGLGKTYTVAHIVRRIINERIVTRPKVLFLAHQIELLVQAVTSFKNVMGIGGYSYSVCFDGSDPEQTDFVFATFDTLFMKLASLARDTFDIVVVDEAHHTPAITYATVVKHFAPRLLVGLSATPYRNDAESVQEFFGGPNNHVGKLDLAWALKNRKLAFPKYVVLLDDLNQSRIDQLRLGLQLQDLDKRLFLHKKDEEVISILESAIVERGIAAPKGIVFCRSIRQIKHLIQFFPAESATLVHSQMTDQQRRANISDFREGSYRYILVCDLFNEGIDIPEANFLVFLRYTASRLIWMQQLGRGLRKTASKDCVYVFDFVGSLDRLYEVQRLVRDIDLAPKDNEEDEERPSPSPHHDNTIEVQYNESAAQILELIENLNYRLASRAQALEALKEYFATTGTYPPIDDVESALTGISCDQIATHFGSYYSYLQTALVEQFDPTPLRISSQKYWQQFVDENHVSPTARAISVASECNGLVAYTESEVADLLGSNVREDSLGALPTPALVEPDSQERRLVTTTEAQSDHLVRTYAPRVTSIEDLRRLPAVDLAEIRKVYHSEFYFLKLLRDFRAQARPTDCS